MTPAELVESVSLWLDDRQSTEDLRRMSECLDELRQACDCAKAGNAARQHGDPKRAAHWTERTTQHLDNAMRGVPELEDWRADLGLPPRKVGQGPRGR